MAVTSMRWLRCASRCPQMGNPTHDLKPFPQTPFNSQSHSSRWRPCSCWSRPIREHLGSFVRKTTTRKTLVGVWLIASGKRLSQEPTRASDILLSWWGIMPELRRSKDEFPRIHLLLRGLAKRRSWWMPVASASTHASDWQQIMPFVPLPEEGPERALYYSSHHCSKHRLW